MNAKRVNMMSCWQELVEIMCEQIIIYINQKSTTDSVKQNTTQYFRITEIIYNIIKYYLVVLILLTFMKYVS